MDRPFTRSFRSRIDLPFSGRGALSSPLADGMMRENLFFPAEGGLAVSLWDQWAAMLAELPRLGRVLAITCNPAAVLGRACRYPALRFGGEDRRFAHGGGFSIDLDPWHRAWAWEQPGEPARYSVEFVNPAGEPCHKVCLTPESDFTRFTEWVHDHQAAGTPAALAEGPEPAAEGAAEGAPQRLRSLLGRLLEEGLPVRVSVGNEGISQSHVFAFREMREMGDWMFCGGEATGWHVRPRRIRHLRQKTSSCCGTRWLLGLDAEGRNRFILSPAPGADRRLWGRLAEEAAKDL